MKKPLKKNAGGEASTRDFIVRKSNGGDVSRGTLPPKRASMLKGYGEGEEAEYVRKSARESLRAMVGMKPYDETNPTEAYRIASTPTPLTAVAGIVKGGGKGLRGVIEKARESTFMKGPGMTIEPETFSKAEFLSRLQKQGFDTSRQWLRGKKNPGLSGSVAPPSSYDELEALYISRGMPPDEAVEAALRDSRVRAYSPGRTLSRQREDRSVTKDNTEGGVWGTDNPNISHSYSGNEGYVIPFYAPKPDLVLDAKGAHWNVFFKQSDEFKKAQKDPNIKVIEVKNILDPGVHYPELIPPGASDEEIEAALRGSTLFIKKPQEGNMPAVNALTGEAFPFRDGGEVSTKDFIAKFAQGSPNPDEVPSVDVSRGTSTSRKQLNTLKRVSPRKKA